MKDGLNEVELEFYANNPPPLSPIDTAIAITAPVTSTPRLTYSPSPQQLSENPFFIRSWPELALSINAVKGEYSSVMPACYGQITGASSLLPPESSLLPSPPIASPDTSDSFAVPVANFMRACEVNPRSPRSDGPRRRVTKSSHFPEPRTVHLELARNFRLGSHENSHHSKDVLADSPLVSSIGLGAHTAHQ